MSESPSRSRPPWARLDTDLVQILAGMFGHPQPDAESHQHHERRDAEEGELEGTGRLLQGDRHERPQYEAYKIRNRPHDAVGDAARAGWKDLRCEHGAGPPETQKAEAPRQAEDPQQQVAL